MELNLDKEDILRITYWHKNGQDSSDDVVRFFCYFLAFNYIYNNEKECGNRISEAKKIRNLIKDTDKLTKNIELNEGSELLIKVQNETQRNHRHDMEIEQYLLAHNETIETKLAIFNQIYQVRCNLFHGSKKMRDERDQKLIKEGADVLGMYIENMLEYFKG